MHFPNRPTIAIGDAARLGSVAGQQPAPTPTGEIQAIVNDLGITAEMLEKAVADLQTRIGAVLAPPLPEAAEEANSNLPNSAARDPMSHAGQELAAVQSALMATLRNVHDLTQRVRL